MSTWNTVLKMFDERRKLMQTFRHPTIGSVGMTEPEAKEKFGEDNVKVYKTSVRAYLPTITTFGFRSWYPTKTRM